VKPTLKAPGSKRLIPQCDILLSTSAFKFNLRHYIKALFENRTKSAEVHETFNFMRRPDPVFSDFLKKDTKSHTLEGLALEDITVGPTRYCTPRHPTRWMTWQASVNTRGTTRCSPGVYTGSRTKAWCLLVHAEASPLSFSTFVSGVLISI